MNYIARVTVTRVIHALQLTHLALCQAQVCRLDTPDVAHDGSARARRVHQVALEEGLAILVSGGAVLAVFLQVNKTILAPGRGVEHDLSN